MTWSDRAGTVRLAFRAPDLEQVGVLGTGSGDPPGDVAAKAGDEVAVPHGRRKHGAVERPKCPGDQASP